MERAGTGSHSTSLLSYPRWGAQESATPTARGALPRTSRAASRSGSTPRGSRPQRSRDGSMRPMGGESCQGDRQKLIDACGSPGIEVLHGDGCVPFGSELSGRGA